MVHLTPHMIKFQDILISYIRNKLSGIEQNLQNKNVDQPNHITNQGTNAI